MKFSAFIVMMDIRIEVDGEIQYSFKNKFSYLELIPNITNNTLKV